MKMSFSKQKRATLIALFICAYNLQVAVAKNFGGNQQLMKDIEALNSVSRDYNTKAASDKSKIDKALSSFESLIGRNLSATERSFLSLQFKTMNILPTFAVKGNNIEVYTPAETSGKKDGTLSVEVINAEKNIFKFAGKTFQLDPNKAIHENIQTMLKELEKSENR